MAVLILLAAVVLLIVARQIRSRRRAAPESLEEDAATHVGPSSNWPWISPGFGLTALLVAVSSAGLTGATDSTSHGGCFVVCVGPSDADVLMLARGLALACAAACGIVGALALLDPKARLVSLLGFGFGGAALCVVALSA
jgi:hypothetical protein